ncbi:MAG: DUF4388 domain-containing protein [Calditrichia bacterium]
MSTSEKILIVDDNPHVLKLLRISLEKAGYEVHTAENGDQGLEMTHKVKHGIEFCWMVRENSEIPMVPFIFLTSLSDKEMEIRGFRAGADEYLIKPVDRNVLLEKVRTLLNRAKRVKSIDDEEAPLVKGFEGNLADLSLAEVVQLLNLNKRSGTLEVIGKQAGKIIFDNGNMTFAEIDDMVAEEAINKMVMYRKGRFKFEPKMGKYKPNIQGSTMNILLEACRLMDEADLKKHNE